MLSRPPPHAFAHPPQPRPSCAPQTQKKLEDIRAAAVAAGVPDLNLPINSVVKGARRRCLRAFPAAHEGA